MGMARKANEKFKNKAESASPASETVAITLNRTDAQNLLLALTSALGGGGDGKKKKKKKEFKPPPPFGK